MIRALYNWTMDLASRPRAAYALGGIAFAESSFFPIPPDVLLIPMVIADRTKAWRLAFICTSMSVLGAIAGYMIGALLFEQIAHPILSFYGYAAQFDAFAANYNAWGTWIVLIGGSFTPFPFKVLTIASGATGLDLPIFIVSAILARALRFYGVAGLVYRFGAPIRDFIEKRLVLVFTAAVIAVVGGFVALKYLI